LVIFYGAAQSHDQSLPLLLDGDFNLLRFSSEKNKRMTCNKWNDLFNSVINTYGLRELILSPRYYTWTNNQRGPTLEKLYRFLMSNNWEDLFPLTIVHKVAREMSTHNPLILKTMEHKDRKRREFMFEKRWLKEHDFHSRVARIWHQHVRVSNSFERMQKKLKNVKNG
jgi:hypothetical protein